MQKKKYQLMGCGGTFDLFHKGHREFLKQGLVLSERLLIGVTSDHYLKSVKKGHARESFQERADGVKTFLTTVSALDRCEILPIDSVHIPSAWEDLPIEAILVTSDSKNGAEKINKKRAKEEKKPLAIESFSLLPAEDGLPIASTRIRQGSINREGRLFVLPVWYTKTLLLPKSLRPTLKKPFGELIDSKEASFSKEIAQKLIAVGDITVSIFYGRGIPPRISVVDFIVERKRHFQNLTDLGLQGAFLTYSVQNTPGHISGKLFAIIRDAFIPVAQGKNVVIQVIGEEDLSVLPLVLCAPLGWVVCYGQPKVGTVKVVVTEESKQHAFELVKKFTMR